MGRKKSNGIKVREWLVLDENGILCSGDEYSAAFPTLEDAIGFLVTVKNDARRLPKIERKGVGLYQYTPKNQGANRTRFGPVCTIVRLSSATIDEYRKKLAEQEKSQLETES